MIKGKHVASCNVWSRQRRSGSLSFAVHESAHGPEYRLTAQLFLKAA